jgi:flagellar M-ring protein FliF
LDRIITQWTDFSGRLLAIWNAQQRQTRMLVYGIAAAIALTAAVWGMLALIKRADYSTLFSNLSGQEAASITQKLKDDKIPYILSDGGSTIRVPSDSVSEERIALAGAGMLKGNGTGYELFDRMNFGMTDFEEKLDKTRAIEGELQRTIAGLDPVQAARVHIAAPDQTLYTATQSPVTASIAITTKPGEALSPTEVRGIVRLVAGAVEGLKPDQVTIVNQDGVMLIPEGSSAGEDGAETALKLTQDQLIAKQRYETNLQANIQSLLDSTLGPKHVAVRIATDMNFDTETVKSDEYAKDPVTRSEQVEKEKYAGSGGKAAAGVPGTTSNIGTYQGQQNGSGNYSRSKVTRNNEISVVHREHVAAPGKVNHTSVAVLMNTSPLPVAAGAKNVTPYTLTTANVAQIRNIVIAAAGLNLANGDQVSVEAIPFNPAVLVDATANGATKFLGMPVWAVIAVGVVALLVVIGILAVSMRKKSSGASLPMDSEFPSFDSSLSADVPSLHTDMDEHLALSGPMLTSDELTREQMIEYVSSVAQENPENVAKLVKIWLAG